MFKRFLCWLRGHDLARFSELNFGGRQDTIPNWLYQCRRCGEIRSGRIWAPAPWPEPPRLLMFPEDRDEADIPGVNPGTDWCP